MASKQSLVEQNAVSLKMLRDYVESLSEEQLAQPMPAGWTVAGVLVHLSFWDQRALTLIEKWQKEGIEPSPIDTDVINEVTRYLCIAIPPREAARIVLETAAKMDGVIEGLSVEMIEEIETNGKTVHLNRASHRNMHVAEIRAALGM